MSRGPRICVRIATPDDAAGVAAVLNEIIATGRHSLLDVPVAVAEERVFIEALAPRGFMHVAEAEDGVIVGVQTVAPWDTFDTHETEHVATMGTWVREGHRRRGVGRALAEASFALARRRGFLKVLTDLRADNPGSLSYHLGMGFAVVGAARRHARVGERLVDVVFVERFLEE